MLVHRIAPHLPGARLGEPGHPGYLHRPQRGGRIDHPDHDVWYLVTSAEGSVGEVFGDLPTWSEEMFSFPLLPGSRRALGTYRLPDHLRVLDLDDPAALVERSLRPAQVVARDLAVTQGWGHRAWDERDPHQTSHRRWQVISWWSFHRPSWTVLASRVEPAPVRVEELTLDHPAVRDAARALGRLLP